MLESKSAGVIESKLTQDQELQIYHVCEALGRIKEVLSNLISDQDVVILTMGIEWVQQLTARANDMYLNFRCWCWSSSSLIRRIYNRLPTQELCITCRYDEAETIFLACVKRKEDYKFVLGQLPICEMPLREAALGAAKLGLAAKNDACQTLLESVQIEICVAKAAQAIEYGDSVLAAAVSSDSLNMEGVWDAIDFYHEATAKEKDIENEARANSQLGSVYKDIQKINKSRANNYFSQCMVLAKSLMPRNLHGIKWFDKAAAALAAYQSERAHISDAEARKAKEPFLNELKEELMALNAAASNGTIKLLEHIYPVHPPKRGGKRDSSKYMKKQVLNVIRHYHPDKQHTQDDPAGQDSREKNSAHEEDKWVVMCEEITKHLNGVWDMEFNCH
jgi:hypothetical protein